MVTDVNEQAVEALRGHATPQVDVAPDAEALVKGDLDVYAPCALGGALDDLDRRVAERHRSSAAAANNQLADEGEHGTADRLLERGITYAPDFLVNAGGVIQVSDELHGFDFERARARPPAIFDHTARGAAARRPSAASPRPSRPTGSPRSGWRASATRAGSGSRPAEPALLVPWRRHEQPSAGPGTPQRRPIAPPVTAKLATPCSVSPTNIRNSRAGSEEVVACLARGDFSDAAPADA